MSDLMDESVFTMPYDMAMGTEIARIQFYNRARRVYQELTDLRKATVAGPRNEYRRIWIDVATGLCIRDGGGPSRAADIADKLVAELKRRDGNV